MGDKASLRWFCPCPRILRPDWKGFPMTSALAYDASLSATKEKSFITLAPARGEAGGRSGRREGGGCTGGRGWAGCRGRTGRWGRGRRGEGCRRDVRRVSSRRKEIGRIKTGGKERIWPDENGSDRKRKFFLSWSFKVADYRTFLCPRLSFSILN